MGIFYAKVSIENPTGGNAHETEASVDIGATTLQILKPAVDTPDERLVEVQMGRRGRAGRLEQNGDTKR